jgi:hypothetical protein
MNIEELVRPETKKHVAQEHEQLHHTLALSCMSLCGLPLNTTYACGFMWAATKTHLIHAGGVDVGRATRSRPIYNHMRGSYSRCKFTVKLVSFFFSLSI